MVGWVNRHYNQLTRDFRRMTPDERTIEEEPGRGRNERTPLPPTTKTTITNTHPGNRNRDGAGHGTVATSVSAFVSGSCLAELVENDNDAEMGTNVGAVEGDFFELLC